MRRKRCGNSVSIYLSLHSATVRACVTLDGLVFCGAESVFRSRIHSLDRARDASVFTAESCQRTEGELRQNVLPQDPRMKGLSKNPFEWWLDLAMRRKIRKHAVSSLECVPYAPKF